MPENSTLPIDIEVRLDRASVERSFADLEAKATSAGRKIGGGLGRGIATEGLEDGAKAYKKVLAEILKDGKAKADELYRINSIQQGRDIQTWQEGVKAFQVAEKAKATAAKQAATERATIEAIQQARDIQTWQEGVKAFQVAEKAKATAAKQAATERATIEAIQQARDIQTWQEGVKAFQVAEKAKATAAKQAATERARIQDIQEKRDYEMWQTRNKPQQSAFQVSGVRSPQDVANELKALRDSKAAWEALGPATEGYKGALDQITRRTNILTEGNARARGSFHKLVAGVASLTFELTGAVYGFLALTAAIGGGAIAGIKFLNSIETAKHGMAANLTAMAQAAGMQMTYAQSSAIASQEIEQLSKNSIKYNVSLEDIAKTYQAIIGPGLAAGMTLKEVGQIATLGTMAVKSLGMNATQVVQEVRDLVQGGIQAASSTLATSLGLKDKDINDAKKSAEGLFVFLEKRMAGYALAAIERQNTLAGAFDILGIKIQRLFADESGFNVFKKVLTDISDMIGVIDYKTGEIKFNQDLLVAANNYWAVIKFIVSSVGTLIEYIGKLLPLITAVGGAFLSWKVGERLLPALEKGMSGFYDVLTKTPSMFDTVGNAAGSFAGRLSGLSMGAKGGLIGLALFATYEVADYFGIIDKIFTDAEGRAKKSRDTAKAQSLMELNASQTVLRKQYDDLLKKEEGAGFFEKGSIVAQRQQVASDMAAVIAELKKREEIDALIEQSQRYMTKGQALKQFRAKGEGLSDQDAANAKYIRELSEIGSTYANIMRSGTATTAEQNEALNIYTRSLEAAKKELDSFGSKDKARVDRASSKAARDAAKEQREFLKQMTEDYRSFESGVDALVTEGAISYTEGYQAKAAALQSYMTVTDNASKLVNENNKNEVAMTKHVDAILADSMSERAKYYGSMMTLEEQALAEFEAANGKKIALLDAEVEALQNLGRALTKEELKNLLKLEQATLNMASAKEGVKNLSKLEQAIKNVENASKKAQSNIAKMELNVARSGGYESDKYAIEKMSVGELAIAYSAAQANLDNYNMSADEATKGSSKFAEEQARLEDAVRNTEKAYLDSKNAMDKTFGRGLDKAVTDYTRATEDMASQTENLFSNAFKSIEDAFTNFIMTGKMDFKSFVNGMIADLARMAAKQIVLSFIGVTGMAGGAGNAMAGGAGGGTDYLGMASNASTVNSGYNYLTGASQNTLSYSAFGTSAANVAGSNMVIAGSAQEAGLASQWAGGGYSTAAGAAGSAAAYGGALGGAYYGYQEHGVGGAAVYGTAGYVGGAALAGGAAAAGGGAAAIGSGAMAGASAALAAIPVWGWVALAALAIFGWADGGAGAPKVNINTLFTGSGMDVSQLQQAPDSTTDLGGKEELTAAIYNQDIAAITAKYAPDKAYTGYLGGHINIEGESQNQNFAYLNTLGRALTDVNEKGEGIIYNNQNPSSGQGVEDWQKWAETEIPRLQMAIVTDAMRTAGGDIGAIATSVVGTTMTDLTDAINSMTEEELGKALSDLYAASKFEFDKFDDLFGEDFDITKFEAAAKEGESIVDTIVRLGDVFKVTNDVVEMLGQDTSSAFGEIGLASEAMRQALIDGAGGMQALVDQASYFYQTFYTDAERAARDAEYAGAVVADAFADMGVAAPTTNEEFRKLVEGLDLSTTSGQTLYQSLMNIAPAFNSVTTSANSAQAALDSINNLQRSLDISLMEASGDSIGALNARREDELASLAKTEGATEDQIAKLVATQQAIYAATDAQAARTAAEEAATRAAEDATRAADDLKNAWQSVTDSIFEEVARIRGLLGSTNTANTEAQFAIATAQARAGDQSAAERLPELSKTLLDSAALSAATAYDLARIQGQTAGSLETTGMILASNYGLSIPSFAVGTDYVPNDMLANIHQGERIVPAAYNRSDATNEELVAEIRALREELRAGNISIASSSNKTAKILDRWDGDGMPAVRVL